MGKRLGGKYGAERHPSLGMSEARDSPLQCCKVELQRAILVNLRDCGREAPVVLDRLASLSTSTIGRVDLAGPQRTSSPLDLLPPPSPVLSRGTRGVEAVPSGGGYLRVSRLNITSGLRLAWGRQRAGKSTRLIRLPRCTYPYVSYAYKTLTMQSLR